MTVTGVTLDEHQRLAASAVPETRQIVLAPPGSGKTEVVAALLVSLAEEHDLALTDEVLAISFSRAAVAVLRRRAPARAGQGAMAIRTLDSLVSRLLDDLDPEEWRHLSFDARVKRALFLLRDDGCSEELGMLRHLVVDEVQDLVGVRAELVLELLGQLRGDVGFTLMGDPRQAVYNFQLQEQSDLTSAAFLEAARGLGDVREVELPEQYRAQSKEAVAAAQLGLSGVEDDRWLRDVRALTSRLFMAGDVGGLARPVRRWPGSTAFLCRTNGEALVVAAALREAGLPVTARSTAEESPVAPWVGQALFGWSRANIRREEFSDLLQNRVVSPPEEAWRLLKSIERDFRSPDRLDLRKLAGRMAFGDLPAGLVGEQGDVVVSTIHRAKGLEFDNVVLVNPDKLLTGGASQDDAAVAYVALTRARDQILAARCETPRQLRLDDVTGRWVVGGHQRWHTFGFEVRGTDTRTDEPVVEGFSIDSVAVGTPVTLQLDPRRSTLEVPVYSVLSDSTQVARTSPSFGELLARRIGSGARRRVPWPDMSGLAVESVETLGVPTPRSGQPLIGLGIRVSGIAHLDWGSNGGSERA